jgi:hypothetical protein
VGLRDEPSPECCKTQLRHGAVVQDVCADVHQSDIVLQRDAHRTQGTRAKASGCVGGAASDTGCRDPSVWAAYALFRMGVLDGR